VFVVFVQIVVDRFITYRGR